MLSAVEVVKMFPYNLEGHTTCIIIMKLFANSVSRLCCETKNMVICIEDTYKLSLDSIIHLPTPSFVYDHGTSILHKWELVSPEEHCDIQRQL